MKESVFVIECTLDDATGEELGFVMERLIDKGALNVQFIPCVMKKSRPAYIMQVLAGETLVPLMEDIIFRQTTTIGLRKYPVDRTCMERKSFSVSLPEGDIIIKKCWIKDIVRYYPEYESVKEAAIKSGTPFKAIFDAAKLKAEKEDGKNER
jgi:uncharacterized protein (DUF111 family)